MSKAVTQDDLFTILGGYEDRLDRLERVATTPSRTDGLVIPGVGITGSKRAGRRLTVADFTQLLGVAPPIALYGLDTLNDSSGNGNTLTNTTAAVGNGAGIEGGANMAARFSGVNAAGLFRADASGGPLNIRTGTFGCWFKTPKMGASQRLMAKGGNTAGQRSWMLSTDPSDVLKIICSTDGTNQTLLLGNTLVHDNQWHFGVGTIDATLVKLYCDGNLDAQMKMSVVGALAQNAQPFNIGNAGISAVAGTGSENLPMFGLIDEAFVHPEVLNEDQIRLLMAAAVPHYAGIEPISVSVKVRRYRRGGRIVQSNFPAPPRRIYNLGADVTGDEGADNAGALTVAGTVPYVDGVDGSKDGAKYFPGTAGNYLTGSVPALVAGAARTVGLWIQTVGTGAQQTVLGLGGGTATDWRVLYIGSDGRPSSYDGTSLVAPVGMSVLDGTPHFIVVTWESAAAEGLKRKLYLDTRMVAADTSFTTPTIGTGSLYFGQLYNGSEFYKGLIDGVFFCDYAMTPEQIAAIFAIGSKQLPAAMFDNSVVEGVDATNLYLLADKLDPQHRLDIRVAA